ncbi:ABC transporter permease [Mycolicibacterium komossense]|uniref:ABC transporter permease n=2 Tax=Mycolicibacterium komossense TaxID=1779 RepID=A0ABT3CB66_9MYCO|nr:ABC transporter permease [Mycolicibacterium komossense]
MTLTSPADERRLGEPLSATSPAPLGARIQRRLHSRPLLGPTAVLVAATVAFTAIVGPAFLQPGNVSLILQQVQIVGMLGVAQTLIVLTAGIDLSVAAIMVLTTVVAGQLATEHGIPAVLALGAALITGLVCGLVNGALVARFRIPPFITTLGTLSVFTALTIWLSDSQTIRGQDLPRLLLWPGQTFTVLGARITYGSILMLLTVIAAAIVLRRTAWGEHVYMVGDNPEGARLSGIRTSRVLLSVYAVAGLVCAAAGWFLIGRVGSISPFSGEGANLTSITAVVIGGTSLFGGRGHVVGTLIGALIVGVFSNGLTLAGVDVLWQTFTTGVLVIVAVGLDQWTRKVAG